VFWGGEGSVALGGVGIVLRDIHFRQELASFDKATMGDGDEGGFTHTG
jgi:hypothetical protein